MALLYNGNGIEQSDMGIGVYMGLICYKYLYMLCLDKIVNPVRRFVTLVVFLGSNGSGLTLVIECSFIKDTLFAFK